MRFEKPKFKNEIREQYYTNVEYVAQLFEMGVITPDEFEDLTSYCTYIYKFSKPNKEFNKEILSALKKALEVIDTSSTDYKYKEYDRKMLKIIDHVLECNEKYLDDYMYNLKHSNSI